MQGVKILGVSFNTTDNMCNVFIYVILPDTLIAALQSWTTLLHSAYMFLLSHVS